MIWLNVVLMLCLFSVFNATYLVHKMSLHHEEKTSLRLDPETFMNPTELITSKGFPCENYWITTADGYILNIIRIPHGRIPNSNHNGPKPVVVLQHGLLGSATNFLTNLVNQSLAYILADAGADVWLGNSRGNTYSMNHTTLNTDDDTFWQFTFDDMAKYDLPAMINFIVKESGSDQVYYVGHSQGTAIGFIQFGRDQELASHIKHFFAMGPVGRVAHIESPIRKLAPIAKDISSRVPVYASHNPAGTSVNNMLHFAQEVLSGEFQMYDYGSQEANMQHYGQASPPLYDPSKVKVPVAVFSGSRDWLADPKDVKWLLPQLNVTHHINVEHYAHVDFVFAVDAPIYIYDTILKIVFQ